MRSALVFGASGQIGMRLLARLRTGGWHVVAVSRQAQHDTAQVHWLRGDLSHVDGLPAMVDAIISCGPLDHFATWYAATSTASARVIAFGSTSVTVKAGSIDDGERALAQRLESGERLVFATAADRGAAATLLRPTLVYGSGRDRSLTRITDMARRWRCFVLPRHANGLRQPVHVDDLAEAAHAAIGSPETFGRAYALPGGETLAYRDMVLRVLQALQPPARLLELPAPLFRLLVRCAHVLGRARDFSDATEARLRMDLVFDAEPARRAFGYSPRAFNPTADMFRP
jgi:nucleoside-diphosphate-sugar epimerase